MDKAFHEILSKLPAEYASILEKIDFMKLQEIRFRSERPITLYDSDGFYFVTETGEKTLDTSCAKCADAEDIKKMVSCFCKHSVYAHQESIRVGYITLSGGHRIGISGTAVIKDGQITTIKDFSGLNIRVAREYKNCADSFLPHISDGSRIYNTVIISPPGVGKTTVLRDIARQLSSLLKVTIVDERSEIAAVKNGVPQFDVGIQTDVLDGFSKMEGIEIALRSLSPQVIITDEMGTEEDISAVQNLLKGGCSIITSMHGHSIEEMMKKKRKLLSLFDTAILMGRKNGRLEVMSCIKFWEVS